MIIITVKSGLSFKYRGDIVLHANDYGIVVSANWTKDYWDAQVTDLFFYDDIVSIVGTDELRSNHQISQTS